MKNHLFPSSFSAAAIAAALGLFGCSTSAIDAETAPFERSGSLETVVLLGTNDIHGALAPTQMRTKDDAATPYEKGGAAIFASHVRILRQQYGDRLILLDGGDQFQGSIDSNLEEGRPMVQFFNELGYAAAAIGNHEFDFGPEGARGQYDPARDQGKDLRGTLKARIAEAKYPYLAANVYEKKTGAYPGIPGTRPSTIVRAGNLRVGILGLTTLETPVKTRPAFARDLEFREMAKTAVDEAKKLREDGAHLVVVVAHAGIVCDIPVAEDRGGRTSLLKSETDFQTGCRSNQEIPELLRRVPKGTIDAVVSGHTHTLVHHWVEGVPVIQAGTQGVYYNLAYLTYDWNQKKVRTDKTRIEGPMPICAKVFANQKNCNGDQPAPEKGRGELVAPRLRGVEIEPDPSMERVLAPTFAKTERKRSEIVGQAARRIPHLKTEESPLGNLVADALRDAVGAQVGLMNPGGVRADWEAGPLRYGDVFRSLPFDNFVAKVTLTGRELRRLIRITHAGARGYFSTSGLRVRAIRLDDEPFSSDLDGNGKIEPWEFDRLLEVTLADGEPIAEGRLYTVATIDFLVSGGDSLGWFMNGVPKERIVAMAGPTLRDSVVAYLAKRDAAAGLNSADAPLVKPNSPRLVLEKRPARKGGGAKAPRRAKKRR